MKEKIKENKKIIIIGIIVFLIIMGLLIALLVINSKQLEKDKVAPQTTENETLNPDEIDIEDEEIDNTSKNKVIKTLADYEGYWFNVTDLRDYIAIREIKDNSLVFDMFLYRLFGMENVKAKLDQNNESTFSYKDDGVTIEGIINVNNQEINLEITKSTFDYIKKGDKYKFNVQMQKKEFEEHMMKIEEGENNK